MQWIVSVVLLLLCIVAIGRRRRRHKRALVPWLLYTIVNLVWCVSSLRQSFATIATVDPTMQATLLAKGISEFINAFAFGLLLNASILVGAWLLDRRLAKKTRPEIAPSR